MYSAQDANITCTCTVNRVQLRSTEETCSIIIPCAYRYKCVCVWGGGGGGALTSGYKPMHLYERIPQLKFVESTDSRGE